MSRKKSNLFLLSAKEENNDKVSSLIIRWMHNNDLKIHDEDARGIQLDVISRPLFIYSNFYQVFMACFVVFESSPAESSVILPIYLLPCIL